MRALASAPANALVVVLLLTAGCGESPDARDDPDRAPESPEDVAIPSWLEDLSPRAAQAEPQARSLLGEELWAQEDEEGSIAAADAALAADPENVDRLIEAGRERRHSWHYRQAMELYTRAAERAPDDWRPYRFRGHRHISLRQFDRAIDDLEAARDRAPRNWDVSYHLALAYVLAGEFDRAADEYLRCLEMGGDPDPADARDDAFRDCSANVDDPESRVAMTDWAVRALLRADRDEEAHRLLDELPADLPVETNVAYHHLLLMYQGERSAEELLDPPDEMPYRMETVGYGVAHWWLTQADTARAVELLHEVARDPTWPGFGRIAAEADLVRLGEGP